MQVNSPISAKIFITLLVLLLQGCAASGVRLELTVAAEQARIDELSRAIAALDGEVDREEAQRAARVAIDYSRQQARDYEITASPLLHNVMVNLGIRERGLCVHWTRDLMVRLQQERFRSLELHWAVANYESTFRVEHSTVIISARGDDMQRGLVLDGWRNSGDLFWAPTLEDPDYAWRPHAEVHALKERRAELRMDRAVVR